MRKHGIPSLLDGTSLSENEIIQHLFECCEEDLGIWEDLDILKCHPSSVRETEEHLLSLIKRMAVIPAAVSVKRSDLLSTKQDHGENARSFFARINVDFTEIIVKDVLISGFADVDIKNEILGCPELDNKSVQETVTFIEAKEMLE